MSTHNMHLKYKYPTIICIIPPGVAPIVTFCGSNNRCLEQIFMVPKRFESSKFYFIIIFIQDNSLAFKQFCFGSQK